MNLEVTKDEHQLAAALLRGVQVQDWLGCVSEGAGLAVNALYPTSLTYEAEHG